MIPAAFSWRCSHDRCSRQVGGRIASWRAAATAKCSLTGFFQFHRRRLRLRLLPASRHRPPRQPVLAHRGARDFGIRWPNAGGCRQRIRGASRHPGSRRRSVACLLPLVLALATGCSKGTGEGVASVARRRPRPVRVRPFPPIAALDRRKQITDVLPDVIRLDPAVRRVFLPGTESRRGLTHPRSTYLLLRPDGLVCIVVRLHRTVTTSCERRAAAASPALALTLPRQDGTADVIVLVDDTATYVVAGHRSLRVHENEVVVPATSLSTLTIVRPEEARLLHVGFQRIKPRTR